MGQAVASTRLTVMEEIQEKSEESIADAQFEKNKLLFKRYVRTGALILLLVFVFWYGFEKGKQSQATLAPVSMDSAVFKNKDATGKFQIDFSLFWNVWDLLKNKYVDASSLDANKLFYGAIKGMLSATGDPYTTFFDPAENKKFNEEITGNFDGIGAELGVKNNILTVIAPLAGTPAEKAGLRAGDKIVKIDGTDAGSMTIEEAVDKIRGPKGSSVTLTIFRDGSQDTQDVVVKRDNITVQSVKLDFKPGNIADIQINSFGDNTQKGFADAISKVKAQNSKGLIIDLRNDPGGYLDVAINIASKLIPKDQIVVIEESGDKSQKKMYTRGGDVASSIPTVILINEGSASASEILAGALRDDRTNVTLIGKKSFGKGSVQELINLPQGTAAKITVARWLTPKGDQINEKGIAPDQEVDLTQDDFNNNRDPQLDSAIKKLQDVIAGK